ncbi:gamma-D-glutamyl-L-lysine endopeptidase [Purpureocillium lavendulum]|uniref:Gamma-D-glutamyl-L-lysine endopeptidase n=1 Tax=Purpureocillium lavendulum TaxID=1247861 RepID=A0AB34FWE2_9HYPO|nr:gamma-D-glutamyl-L-lysine endopeptidase [Purpureocillium lavendulum]
MRTHSRFVALATAITLPVLQAASVPVGAVDAKRSTSPQVAYVNVSVSTLWTDSSKPRPVDAPALESPAHIQEWLDSMTKEQYLDLSGSSRTQSQALYGAKIYIVARAGSWCQVAVPGQPSPDNDLGYPGWIPCSQATTHDAVYGHLQSVRPFAQVKKGPTAPLYRDVLLKHKLMDVSFDTRLPEIARIGKAIQVAVPGGLAFLSSQDASVYKAASDIPYPTGEDLVETGKMFLGRPYLWGGTSGFAFDCSGFTHTIYDSHGITIGRDAGPQAYFAGHGTPVDRADLRAGDLIFYASNLTNAKSIYHVAMFAGDGNMLEAYASGTPTRLTPVRFNEDYWGAERFLKERS